MWIRSQKGMALANVNEIWMGLRNCPDYYIYGNHNTFEVSGIALGVYTEKEAMEVMNMLQRQIEAIEYFKARNPRTDMPCPDFVFQMPEAGFSEEG